MIKTNLDTMTEEELKSARDYLYANTDFTIKELVDICDQLEPYYTDADKNKLEQAVHGKFVIPIDYDQPHGTRIADSIALFEGATKIMMLEVITAVYNRHYAEALFVRLNNDVERVVGKRANTPGTLFEFPVVSSDFFSKKDQMDE